MDERIKFVARLLDGEKIARLCSKVGISHKSGYKIFNQYIVPSYVFLASEDPNHHQ